MTSPYPPYDRFFLRCCAVLAFTGYAAIILANIAGSIIVPGHDPMADTISDLGAGRYEIIQDLGFYGYAAGLTALSMALANLHPGGMRWTTGLFAVAIVAALTIVIGARNEYGDNDSDGVVIHIYLVYGLALLIGIAPFALRDGVRHWGESYARISVVFGIVWWVAAPVFFFMPTGWDGAWERGLGVAATAWFTLITVGVWREADR